jgi:hypothetical protein
MPVIISYCRHTNPVRRFCRRRRPSVQERRRRPWETKRGRRDKRKRRGENEE